MDEQKPSTVAGGETADSRGPGRSLRRSFSAVATALLLILVVSVGRSELTPDYGDDGSDGYGVPLPAQTQQFSAHDVELSDDDGGHPLFNAGNLKPGSRMQDCVTVTYTGTAPNAVLSLAVAATGALAPHLATVVERGAGGKFQNCSGFRDGQQVFTGSLADLAAQAGPDNPRGIAVGQVVRDEATTFRFSFVVSDEGVAQGATAGADFLWSAHA